MPADAGADLARIVEIAGKVATKCLDHIDTLTVGRTHSSHEEIHRIRASQPAGRT